MQKFLVIFEESDDSINAYVPGLPGCVAVGNTKEEVEELIYNAIKFHIEGMKLDGLPIPQNRIESEVMVIN